MINGKEFSRPTKTALYFVCNEQGAVTVAKTAEQPEEIFFSHINATHTLDGLYDNSCHFFPMGAEISFQGRCIIERDKVHVVRFIHRGQNIPVVCSSNGKRCPSVK